MKRVFAVFLIALTILSFSGCNIFDPEPVPTPTPTPTPTPITDWDYRYNVSLIPVSGGLTYTGVMKFEFVLSIFAAYLKSDNLSITIEASPGNGFATSASYSSQSGYSFTAVKTTNGVEEKLALTNFHFYQGGTMTGTVSYTDKGVTRSFNCMGTSF